MAILIQNINQDSIKRLPLYLIMAVTIVDAVNGYIIRNYDLDLSLSQFYKFILICVMIPVIYRKLSFVSYIYFLLTSYFIFTAYHFVRSQDYHFIIEDILALSKLVYPVIVYVYVKSYIEKNDTQLTKNIINSIFIISYLVIVLNIGLTHLNIGYYANEKYGGLAAIGFFKSGNALAATFLIVSAYLFLKIWSSEKGNLAYIAFGLFTILTSIGLHTKTAIVGIFVIFIMVPLIVSPPKLLKLRLSRSLLLLGVIFIASVASAMFSLLYFNLGIIQKITFFYERYGLFFAATSGRTVFLQYGMDAFINNYNLFDWMFGKGYSAIFTEVGAYYSREKIIEMDLFDILLSFGVLGIVVSYSMWILFFRNSIRLSSLNRIARTVLLVNMLVLMISTLAGHVMFGGMIGTFIGLANGIVYMKWNKAGYENSSG